MAVYKVPQDVEADDKLIGPFSFRQFIYLLIVAGAGFIGYLLSQLFLPLFVIVLPVVALFGALALPLRKDQPMEIYLAAIVSFYLKPRRRLWAPDGTQAFVEITVPNVVEIQRVKDISQDEAEQRLSYLASIVDSRGWAVRGVQGQAQASPGAMNNDAYLEAQSTPDILDNTSGVGQAFDTRLDEADAKRHQDMINSVRNQSASVTAEVVPPPQGVIQPVMPSTPVADPYANLSPQVPAGDGRQAAFQAQQPQTNSYAYLSPEAMMSGAGQATFQAQQQAADPYAYLSPQSMMGTTAQNDTATQPSVDEPDIDLFFNPYPTMHQSVISPIDDDTSQTQQNPVIQTIEPEPEKPSEKPLSPDIINLANNPDLSVETIAREANRIHEKEKLSEDEVVISLR